MTTTTLKRRLAIVVAGALALATAGIATAPAAHAEPADLSPNAWIEQPAADQTGPTAGDGSTSVYTPAEGDCIGRGSLMCDTDCIGRGSLTACIPTECIGRGSLHCDDGLIYMRGDDN